MKKQFVLAFLPLIALSACSSEPVAIKPIYEEKVINHPKKTQNNEYQLLNDDYLKSVQAFAADYLALDTSNENKIFSPVSIATCFSMLYEGAEGNTKTQLEKVFHYSNLFTPKEEIKKMLLNSAISDKKDDIYLDIAQSLWLIGQDAVKEDYVKTLTDYYFAELFEENLTSYDSLKPLTNWLNVKTNNFLNVQESELTDFVDPNAVMWLFNTVYLKSKWVYAFEEKGNKIEPFTNIDGQESTVVYMRRYDKENYFRYYTDDDFEICSIPFKKGMNIQILLPNEGTNYSDIVKSKESIQTLLNWNYLTKKSAHFDLKIPKWDIKQKSNLIGNIAALGAEDLFNDGCNLKGIREQNDLYISAAQHCARLKIDNNGVEAAAYTGIEGTTKAMPPETPRRFFVTRPFLYSVTDSYGLPLFVGANYSLTA